MSNEIFRYVDEDGDELRVAERQGYLKLRLIPGSDHPIPYMLMDPKDVVALRNALTETIDRNGWDTPAATH